MTFVSLNQATVLPVSTDQELLARKASRAEKVPSKKIIRDLGLKVTTQRLLILDLVRKGPSHFTAQDVYENVSAKNSAIGFATVYRFLRTLSEQGFVTEVRMGGMPARYEWAAKRHHDHLTCTVCGSINEFENPEIERLQEKVAKEFGFQLTEHILELYGICPDCRRKDSAKI
ncbi:MAG: transcriptional repressor [Bdellovibrionota bacterium]